MVLVVRRRGQAIRPVCQALYEHICRSPALANASIEQRARVMQGVRSQQFYVLREGRLKLVFTLALVETEEHCRVETIQYNTGAGDILTPDQFEQVKQEAMIANG